MKNTDETKIYYIGIGAFGYGIFYDESGESIRVGSIYKSWEQVYPKYLNFINYSYKLWK